MFELAVESLKANRSRLIATVVAIVIGVAFLSAGLMFTDAIRSSLGADIERAYADVAAVVRPSNPEFGGNVPATVVDLVGEVQGVDEALPELEGTIGVDQGDDIEQLTGRLWSPEGPLSPTRIVEGEAPTASDEFAIDRASAEELGLAVGDEVSLTTALGALDATVVGLTEFGDRDARDNAGTILIPADQFALLTGGPEEYDRVLIASDESPDVLIARLDDVLPDGLEAVDHEAFVDEAVGDAAIFASFLRPVLTGFSLLALFVCGFVIANTFAVVIAQRTRELALLRAVGATPRQVRRSVRLEGLVVGLVSSVIGIGAGALLAIGAAAVLRAFDVELPGAGVRVTVPTIVVGLLVGTLVTLVSVNGAARRAAKVPPAEAMRDAAIEARPRPRSAAWLVVVAVGIGGLLASSFAGIGWLMGLTALVFVIGLFRSTPLIARWVAHAARPIVGRRGMSGRLAVDNLERNPRRSSATANALVIGVLLISLVTSAGGTIRDELVRQVDQLSGSDLIVTSSGAGLPEGLVDQIRETDGVSAVAPVSAAAALIDGEPGLLSAADTTELDRASGLEVSQGSIEDLGDDNIAIVEIPGGGGGNGAAQLGESIEITTLGGTTSTFVVTALLEPEIDSLIISNLVSPAAFEQLMGPRPATHAFVDAQDDREAEVKDELERLAEPYSTVFVTEGNFLGELVRQVFDFLIAAVNGLLAMSILIALVGIINTMSLSILERRREIGLLRAVGMSAGEARRMVRWESVLIAIFGTVVGLAGGVFIGFCVTRPIGGGPTGEGTIGFSLEWGRLGLVVLAGVLIGLIAAMIPARRVARLGIVESIRAE